MHFKDSPFLIPCGCSFISGWYLNRKQLGPFNTLFLQLINSYSLRNQRDTRKATKPEEEGTLANRTSTILCRPYPRLISHDLFPSKGSFLKFPRFFHAAVPLRSRGTAPFDKGNLHCHARHISSYNEIETGRDKARMESVREQAGRSTWGCNSLRQLSSLWEKPFGYSSEVEMDPNPRTAGK